LEKTGEREKMKNNQEMEKSATDSRRYWNLWQALRGIASEWN
jgi:hypothetical protein